jgi:hypothetical protein
MKKITLAIFFLMLSNSSSSEISDTTYKCTVTADSKNKYSDIQIHGLSDSSITVLKDDYSKEILIKDIQSIKFNGRGFMKGAAIGGGIGFVLGAIIGAQGVNLGSDGSAAGSFHGAVGLGFALGVPFGLIGGGLGALFAEDKFYDLSKLDFESKRKQIKYLIKEYSDS